MTELHLHLLLNHVPILGSLFGLLVLGAGVAKSSSPVSRTGLVMLLGAALVGLPTQLTGEGAREALEKLPGISHHLIQAHEAAAELGFWALELTGVLALLALLRTGRERLFIRLTLATAILSFGLLVRAGNLGGQIRHPEIRE
ncbi:hypothetical protein [Hymenobacter rubripertinctus]|uniref:DUF2231 domain-containing protein n=1 Tax=Hymenobacter rubripertinctus TaxID=2029981 RepID=A0A418QVK8_9BACT|nr:hypothetical protein [Hymenobacter rubripertinctus]RIY09256.1 hypothetical protein D0T11_12530 [Hymenobacter rubripertinctus]